MSAATPIPADSSARMADLRSPARSGPGAFDNALSVFTEAPPESREQAAQEAAQEFVSVSLIQPILASLRETNHAAEPFAPGDAERRFGPLWDAEIAQRISRAENFPLVDEVARRLLSKSGAAAQPTQTDRTELDLNA